MRHSENISSLSTALAAAHAEIENASKNSKNPHFNSKYADLAEIINTIRPVFSRHGLSVTQEPSLNSGIVTVTTLLMHNSGEWIASECSVPVGKQDAQGVGSAITYCRRYAMAAIACIAQEDDDANSAVGNGAKQQQPSAKKAEPARQPERVNVEELYKKINLLGKKMGADDNEIISMLTNKNMKVVTEIEAADEAKRARLMTLVTEKLEEK